ncbi:hypothetical protein Salat_1739300 [Sesamum alatum]|uniref:Uncharacterized protein n=1 Tax=Sesamum alatum TaxID=300844 RepID=A0AAE1Y859_9LAMI|nr:hypothetical protein Salat_1739300 [Sesamum alatum]
MPPLLRLWRLVKPWRDPPPGFLTVYSVQLLSGLRFPLPPLLVEVFNLLGIPPSQLLPNSYWKLEWDVPTAWAWSLNVLPPLNLGDIKRVMKEACLVDHEFNAKATLDEELLIVVGLHLAPDRYEGPSIVLLDFIRIMMNRVVVCKFIPDDVPAMPSSSGTRSAPSTPSDLPLELTPRSTTTPPPIASLSGPQETPDVPLSSPLPLPVEEPPFSHKRPCISVEGAKDTPSVAGPSEPAFQAPVLTPYMDPQAGAFNMLKAVNRADVEIPAVVTAMVEKYAYSLKNCEMLRRELQKVKAAIQGQCAELEAQARERENKLKEELEILKNQMVEKDSQIAMMTMENAAIRSSTMQAYARGREEGASSAVIAFKDSA